MSGLGRGWLIFVAEKLAKFISQLIPNLSFASLCTDRFYASFDQVLRAELVKTLIVLLRNNCCLNM